MLHGESHTSWSDIEPWSSTNCVANSRRISSRLFTCYCCIVTVLETIIEISLPLSSLTFSKRWVDLCSFHFIASLLYWPQQYYPWMNWRKLFFLKILVDSTRALLRVTMYSLSFLYKHNFMHNYRTNFNDHNCPFIGLKLNMPLHFMINNSYGCNNNNNNNNNNNKLIISRIRRLFKR